MKNIGHYTATLSLFVLLMSINISAMEIDQPYVKPQSIETKAINELTNRVNNLEKALGNAQAMIQELKDSLEQKVNRLKQSIGSTQEIISNTGEKLNMLASQVDRMSLSGSQ